LNGDDVKKAQWKLSVSKGTGPPCRQADVMPELLPLLMRLAFLGVPGLVAGVLVGR
jgi:hypothetical protein